MDDVKLNKMDFYFFRDLDNESNLLNGKTYHAAGIVEKVYNTEDNENGNKDLSVAFFDPFEGTITRAWRNYKEVQLFQVGKWQWNNLKEQFDKLHSITNHVNN